MAEEVGSEQLDVGEDLSAFALLSICYTFPEELSEGQVEEILRKSSQIDFNFRFKSGLICSSGEIYRK